MYFLSVPYYRQYSTLKKRSYRRTLHYIVFTIPSSLCMSYYNNRSFGSWRFQRRLRNFCYWLVSILELTCQRHDNKIVDFMKKTVLQVFVLRWKFFKSRIVIVSRIRNIPNERHRKILIFVMGSRAACKHKFTFRL